MTAKELIDILNQLPPSTEVTINYIQHVDMGETISCTEDVEDAVYDKYSQTIDLMTKEYKNEG